MDAGCFREGLEGDLQNILVANSQGFQLGNICLVTAGPWTPAPLAQGTCCLAHPHIPRTKHSA